MCTIAPSYTPISKFIGDKWTTYKWKPVEVDAQVFYFYSRKFLSGLHRCFNFQVLV